ncbi:protein FAR-RED IMPAIRED RESPONSE 1-like [Prunus avium]|uniref:Protein FAR1-RELATED SEQUENCE n=1 Tax=Prunus avium TaxID=42229 RepID=A0A6P5TRG5_PRUAV|nr:protein FAR-RED IMPAIRED RESPONSE 1-like [Prunus avium]
MEGDATAIQNYFLNMQSKNTNFFYAIDLDQDGRLRNVFWADARSRAAYEEFGDVVTFDTTYLTNKYDMPFAPFVGVNHHGQLILLGCGLISSEDANTFIWLFKSWLACIYGCAPKGIITDQDKAMKKAIAIVFPNTRHRLCLWHIMNKIPQKLSGYKEYQSISFTLNNIVYDSLNQDEFEEGWAKMIEKYKLQNDWLDSLYIERHHWVPAFVKNSFWAGMSTTQRSESMNAFFDGHVNSKTTLKQFVDQYDNALRIKVENETKADCNCLSSRIPCVTHFDMETQVEEVYTITKFKEFYDELIGKMYCDRVLVQNFDSETLEYHISDVIKVEEKKKKVIFKVLFKQCDQEVKCNCCLFEFKGILCRHAIYVLTHHEIDLIPDKYIMRRWRKDVKRCHTRVKVNYADWKATPEAQRSTKMQKTFDDIKELANSSDDKCMIVMTWMHKLMKEISNYDGVDSRNQQASQSPIGKKSENDVNGISNSSRRILTPLAVRSKGRPPSKRKQSMTEQAIKRKQQKEKKRKSQKDLTQDFQPVISDAVCPIGDSLTYGCGNVVATQESNIIMKV